MPYQNQKNAMRTCIEWFDSIGYAGIGRDGLLRCIIAFEAGDKDQAICEYRRTIGDAANFATALSDLDTNGFSNDQLGQHACRVMAVMFGMSLLMGGNVK